MYQTLFQKNILVFGCGNPLFGDDGFGPAVIAHLEKHHTIPENCEIMDAGTSIRDILFDMLLLPDHPEKIIIVDAVNFEGHKAGEIFEIDVNDIPRNKTSDFSLHQFPTTNMLRELNEGTDIDVRVFVVQTQPLPNEVAPGLSIAVEQAISNMCDKILTTIAGKQRGKKHVRV
ncbi:coenzyme F420 hydrogenase subunit delta [Desulfocicer vacuolatum DSM 3385]|uniref:Coenzyme F420 hydrogenase subunit delta n=1 Tax=Desulfocicer vacuolatum DSM 3385 TaxID=1121400 RepID=A0A1W2AYF0_9BACT|nr:hydrogenase maturation protease [Desulfocicer vacuolatum]SMC65644.1 coenzyme F420 hydrogenase subunit delta [Desulfocicer vacuolatum DSM 3385]